MKKKNLHTGGPKVIFNDLNLTFSWINLFLAESTVFRKIVFPKENIRCKSLPRKIADTSETSKLGFCAEYHFLIT